ncbi:hypothetical protein Nepgr_008047 [Nepenthes gracilis]|uniref:Uncharacterized protein n=1 Tax=Nepenthes gracilis TaxID=150966 RepID=A0AAD3XIU7_NEPGR|nr:hypothetical protein Nepgr_008047 [Nepenthes gracilis]
MPCIGGLGHVAGMGFFSAVFWDRGLISVTPDGYPLQIWIERVGAAPHDVGTSVRKIGSHSISDEFSWDRQSCSPASKNARLVGSIFNAAQQMDSDPFRTTFACVLLRSHWVQCPGPFLGSTNAEHR